MLTAHTLEARSGPNGIGEITSVWVKLIVSLVTGIDGIHMGGEVFIIRVSLVFPIFLPVQIRQPNFK